MEFDCATATRSWSNNEIPEWNPTAMEMIKSKYEKVGYKLPTVVFWNLNARTNNFPVRHNEMNPALISGFSP